MIISNAIMSCNDNPYYLEFWPVVSKVWKLRFNVDPILAYVSKSDAKIDETYGKVIRLNPDSSYDIVLQSQFARIWYAGQISGISVLTDIDMIPVSKWYFVQQLADIPDDKYVNVTPTGFHNNRNVPLCYNIARDDTFRNVLDIKGDFSQFLHDNVKTESWSADEEFLTEKIVQYHQKSVLHPIPNRFERINRTDWSYVESLIGLDYYADCHSLRPYSEHRFQIDKIVKLLC